MVSLRKGPPLFVAIALGIAFAIWVACTRKRALTEEPSEVAVVTAAINDDVVALERLKEAGCDLDAQDPLHFKWTPLMAAIYFQSTNAVSFLVRAKVDIKKRDANNNTALMWAVTMARLLQFGGCPTKN